MADEQDSSAPSEPTPDAPIETPRLHPEEATSPTAAQAGPAYQQPVTSPVAPPAGDPPPMPAYPTTPGPPPTGYGYAPLVPQPMTPSDERMWAMLSHLSILAFSIIAPIIILAAFGKRSLFVSDQAKEALNFHLTVLIAAIVSAVLILVIVGIFLLAAVGIGSLVFGVIAAIKAYEGQAYRYPITIRFIS
jgi:uncharacterized protein